MNQKIHQDGRFRSVEHPAGGTIQPGMLIEINATGAVIPHAVAGGTGESMFAQEDGLQGGTLAGYPNYEAGTYSQYTVAGRGGAGPDPVRCYIESPGSIALGLLKAGFTYIIGTKLISAGDGTLKPTTGTPAKTYAVCTVAIDLISSTALNTCSQIRVY